MFSFLSRLSGWLGGSRPRLVCAEDLWAKGVRELERRTRGGRRESGAFLLGHSPAGGPSRIHEFAFYDDIDPHALDTGIVKFAGARLSVLWQLCRQRGYGVVADVHVHSGGYGQSASDRADPVMPRAGHIAVIIPNFARREMRPGGIGLYEYLGNGRWRDRTAMGERFFRLEARR
ncbi:MAG TPA: hypothetical protein VN668_02275 [Stellaceae bacterium]|nr:hypothetical protein [Stellaceae bacterium]